jgi:hypothetical protein
MIFLPSVSSVYKDQLNREGSNKCFTGVSKFAPASIDCVSADAKPLHLLMMYNDESRDKAIISVEGEISSSRNKATIAEG